MTQDQNINQQSTLSQDQIQENENLDKNSTQTEELLEKALEESKEEKSKEFVKEEERIKPREETAAGSSEKIIEEVEKREEIKPEEEIERQELAEIGSEIPEEEKPTIIKERERISESAEDQLKKLDEEIKLEEGPEITKKEVVSETAKELVPSPHPEPQVIEKEVIRIKEVPRELSREEKEEIFQSKLKENLRIASKSKQEEYEKHLQEMIDFIKTKGTLVTNQDIEAGLRIPDSTVTDRLNELVKRGLITRLGTRFNAKYRLTKPI